MMPTKVLVTGSSGKIGQAVVAELLRRGHLVRGFDLVPTPGLTDMIVGTLTDRTAVDRATQGMQTLVHLAVTPDDDDFLEKIVPNNIVGVYHVMESAQQAGMTRLILASSGQVTWYDRNRGDAPVTPQTPPSPRYWYACGKVFLEAAGRSFVEKFGLSVLAVRLGWCPRPGQEEEIRAQEWAHDVYLSPNDAGRFFACAVESPNPLGFAIVYATSRPVRRTLCDLEPTKRLLGYEPTEQWPQGMD